MNGRIADYQMSAWLMAARLNGLNARNRCTHPGHAALGRRTRATLGQGAEGRQALDRRRRRQDQHLSRTAGSRLRRCSADDQRRGLGHTGGTLDKLEAIPGYSVDLDARRFEQVVREVGVSMIGQTDRLAPADKRIYALRDVTGTVESVPLIVASILSKKLAEGIDGLVLDVKVGRGAFMKNEKAARGLAQALVSVAKRSKKRVVALLTDMSAPLGTTIGNALETREAIHVLNGEGPEDTRELTLALGVEMLLVAKVARNRAEARQKLELALDSGAGLERLERMVRAHGGDARVVREPERLPRAPERLLVAAPRAGVVRACDPLELGLVALALGAGRSRANQQVDPAVGIELVAKRGNRVNKGAPLAFLHARSRRGNEPLVARAAAAFSIGRSAGATPRLVIGRVG